MDNFIYNIPTKVYFGQGQLDNLKEEVKKYGNKILVTYGSGSIKKIGLYDKVINLLKEIDCIVFELSGIEPNPKVESARLGQKIAKEKEIDLILAVGGGSVIDLSKLISASAYSDCDPWELVINPKKITKCLPIITILTLAATGSEMNGGGVISNPDTNQKLGVKSPLMVPKVSFLDPTLTYTVSKFQTACGSADILSHIMESYFVPNDSSMYMLDKFKEGLMKTVIKYSKIALKDPTNYEARENLMWAASWGINGMISNKQKVSWSCHSIEHELSAYYDITHGLGLAIITPKFLRYILDDTTLDRFYEFGINVFDISPKMKRIDVAKEAIRCLEDYLYHDLGLSSNLTSIGIDTKYFKEMSKGALKGKEYINGFKKLYQEDIENILKNSL